MLAHPFINVAMPKPKKSPKPTTEQSLPGTSLHPDIPPPFSPAPENLGEFLSTLSPDHIYITSLDSHPRDFKRRIFAVPLFLNIFLTIVVLYRFQHALPAYLSLIAAVLGYDNPAKINAKNTDGIELFKIGGKRALMFLGDFILVRFVGMWPRGFFLGMHGEASPVGWRRLVGFRAVEIVVRRSRKWDVSLFTKEDGMEELRGEVNRQWLKEGKKGESFNERVVPAVNKRYVKTKTSYLMLDKSWELYFSGMVKAHALVDEAQNKMEDFQTAVFVYSKSLGWLVWEVWREHDEGSGDEGTKKLQLIKDKLTVMGKENLFFRWIEVVQSETSQPGPFNAERQRKAIEKIKVEFEEQGVTFDEFWAGVGGLEDMPGMEITG